MPEVIEQQQQHSVNDDLHTRAGKLLCREDDGPILLHEEPAQRREHDLPYTTSDDDDSPGLPIDLNFVPKDVPCGRPRRCDEQPAQDTHSPHNSCFLMATASSFNSQTLAVKKKKRCKHKGICVLIKVCLFVCLFYCGEKVWSNEDDS